MAPTMCKSNKDKHPGLCVLEQENIGQTVIQQKRKRHTKEEMHIACEAEARAAEEKAAADVVREGQWQKLLMELAALELKMQADDLRKSGPHDIEGSNHFMVLL